MPSFSFAKLIPGGNSTILLPEPPFTPEELPDISARLMDPMHLQAEQVGAVYGPWQAPPSLRSGAPGLPRLQMMGGEFCVNATRSAALLLTRQGMLAPLSGSSRGPWGGELAVSGMEHPAAILTALDQSGLEAAVADFSTKAEARNGFLEKTPPPEKALLSSGQRRPGPVPVDVSRLYCAARIDCAEATVSFLEQREGVTLVRLPGIAHLLVNAAFHPLPDTRSSAWRAESSSWRAASGLAGSSASGIVWFERLEAGYRIWPAVEVAATSTEHLETACGSASLAIALMHCSGEDAQEKSPAPALDVYQPSGEALRVFPGSSSSFQGLTSAWIAGFVRLVAEGTAYFEHGDCEKFR